MSHGEESDVWGRGWSTAPPWFPSPPPDPDEPDVELLEHLSGALGLLSERHCDVLDRRLGLSSGSPETLQEIGDTYGVSRERIRQVEAKAVGRLTAASTRARRGQGDPTLALITTRLDVVFRTTSTIDRARYLRSTFPVSKDGTLARLVGALSAARPTDVSRWLRSHDDHLRQERAAQRESRARARADARRTARWDAFLGSVVWPGTGSSVSRWPGFVACRDVGPEGGARWSDKAGRPVHYESGLEEGLVELFEESPAVVDMCEQPLRIQYPWFGGPRTYVPDFAIALRDGRVVIVEGKPSMLWADGINLAKWNAAVRFCGDRGWGFAVYDGRRHPGHLVDDDGPGDFAVLEELTTDGPVGWDRLGRAWFSTGRTWSRLQATALTHGFALARSPIAVHRARRSPWLDALRDHARRTRADG